MGSGTTITSSPRRMATMVMRVFRRTSRSAMLRSTPGESVRMVTQSMTRPPTTASMRWATVGWK